MKQTSFFTDAEVKYFSQTDKIKLVLDKLCTNLQAIETSSKKDYTWTYNGKKRYWTIIFNSCNFDNVNNINIPFKEIGLRVTEEKISILGPDYNLIFAPDQLLTIQNRYKKIKELQ